MGWSTCAVARALRGGAPAAWSVILCHPVALFMPEFKVGCPYFGSHGENPEQRLETRSWKSPRSETNKGNARAPNDYLDRYPPSATSSGVEQGADLAQSTDPATGECYFLMGLQPGRGNGFWWVPAWTVHTTWLLYPPLRALTVGRNLSACMAQAKPLTGQRPLHIASKLKLVP